MDLMRTSSLSQPFRFLIVDDDACFNGFVSKMVADMGHIVTGTANDGIEAIEKFSQNRELIDVVLMDVMMPRKNGISSALEIMSINPEIKIIMMSANPTNREFLSGISKVSFLKKPFLAEEITHEISK